MPFYLANGQIIRNELESYLRHLQAKYDYREVRTPLMMNQRLWEQSGHWDHYKDNMYFTQVDDQSFALKPMNCPRHMLILKMPAIPIGIYRFVWQNSGKCTDMNLVVP